MKWLIGVVKSAVILYLACVVFGVDVPVVQGSPIIGILCSSAALTLLSWLTGLPLLLVGVFGGGLLGALLGEGDGAIAAGGAVVGATLMLPAMFVLECVGILLLPRLVLWFPTFSWWQVILIMFAQTITSLNLNTDKKKTEA